MKEGCCLLGYISTSRGLRRHTEALHMAVRASRDFSTQFQTASTCAAAFSEAMPSLLFLPDGLICAMATSGGTKPCLWSVAAPAGVDE
eukprot:scaffold304154_cov35-Prasinocladus_malaysianus.AAC.1